MHKKEGEIFKNVDNGFGLVFLVFLASTAPKVIIEQSILK